MAPHQKAILREGDTCWRIAFCERAAFLVDGEEYFQAFREAVKGARESILILGWDIDSRTQLIPENVDDGLPRELGPFLNAVVSRRRGLHAYLLGWDFAMIYMLEREFFPVMKLAWQTHRRVHFMLDGNHPIGASHHQKIVVIDDELAFVGGFDLTIRRWDNAEHQAWNPLRVDPAGKPYAPFHDVQMMVSGPVAAHLGELARKRWQRATGQSLAPVESRQRAVWPASQHVDIEAVAVAIARTQPAHSFYPEIREIQKLHVAAIQAAMDVIYIENQYFSSEFLGEILAARLREATGPELILVLPKQASGWLETSTMDVLRARVLQRLQDADVYGRLRAYYPDVPGLAEHCVGLHSKILIVDDRLLRIGSSNASNRSMGFDTECDLAMEAVNDPRVAESIRAFRHRLLGEHLGMPPDHLETLVQRHGSLVRALDNLAETPRGLRPLTCHVPEMLGQVVPDMPLIDPERPLAPDELFKEFVPVTPIRTRTQRLLPLFLIVSLLAGLAMLWQWSPLRDWLNVNVIVTWIHGFGSSSVAPFVMVAAFVLGSLVMMPVTLLILTSALAFGPVLGFLVSWVGALLSAALTYGIGARLARQTVRRLSGPRLNFLSRKLAKKGILTVAAVRMFPVAPFAIVNMVAGSSHIRFRDFMLGTVVGMSPGLFALTLFGSSLQHLLIKPSLGSVLLLFLVIVFFGAGLWFLQKYVGKSKGDGDGHDLVP